MAIWSCVRRGFSAGAVALVVVAALMVIPTDIVFRVEENVAHGDRDVQQGGLPFVKEHITPAADWLLPEEAPLDMAPARSHGADVAVVTEDGPPLLKVRTDFEPQVFIYQENVSNVNTVYGTADTLMFGNGNINATNSIITFNGRVQFFVTEGFFYLGPNSYWKFAGTVEIMVFTFWVGEGTIEFLPGSNLTICSSNTLDVRLNIIFRGEITIGNLRTKIILNGPTVNYGKIICVDRTSEYVCQTPTDVGRCRLEGTVVTSLANDLRGWRIAQQLQTRGGIMEVVNCDVSSQTTLPFELYHRSIPIFDILEIHNVTRAAIFCNCTLGPTALMFTTVLMIDTSCTHWGNSSYSNVAYPNYYSDGWVVDWGIFVWANTSRTSKALYIDSGAWHIDGRSFYIDVIETDTTPFTVALLYYNSSSCRLDWTDYVSIHGCPDGVFCWHSGRDLGNERCVFLFHFNDWTEPSDGSLWWLLLLLIPCCCCFCCLFCCWCRRRRQKRDNRLREQKADADRSFPLAGVDHDSDYDAPNPISRSQSEGPHGTIQYLDGFNLDPQTALSPDLDVTRLNTGVGPGDIARHNTEYAPPLAMQAADPDLKIP